MENSQLSHFLVGRVQYVVLTAVVILALSACAPAAIPTPTPRPPTPVVVLTPTAVSTPIDWTSSDGAFRCLFEGTAWQCFKVR